MFRDGDPRTFAVIVSGALDAVVAQHLADPAFDVASAGAELERSVLRMLEPGAAPSNVGPPGISSA